MPRKTLAEPVESEGVAAGVKMGTGRATTPLPGGGVPVGMTTAATVGTGVGVGSGVSGTATNEVAGANVGGSVAVAAGVGTGVPAASTCTTSERPCWTLPRIPRTV